MPDGAMMPRHWRVDGSRFQMVATGLSVADAVQELAARSDLWGRDATRLWLRWRADGALAPNEPHLSAFCPAWHALPSFHRLVHDVAASVRATAIGGIVIAKTLPGEAAAPCRDDNWHASFYATRLHLVLQSNPLCLDWVEDEPLNARAGDIFQIPGGAAHAIENGGRVDRLTCLIYCRTE